MFRHDYNHEKWLLRACRCSSLPENHPAGESPCRRSDLPEKRPAGEAACRRSSLPEKQPAGEAACRCITNLLTTGKADRL